MELVETPAYIPPTLAEIDRVTDAVLNGDENDALHYACEYLATHCADAFARQLIETAFARIDEPDDE